MLDRVLILQVDGSSRRLYLLIMAALIARITDPNTSAASVF
jgi:hypothetical protein